MFSFYKLLGVSKHHWLILLAVLNIHEVTAQAPACILQHYSTDNGLSHSGVMCMLEDHLGFVWFGTWDGLNRFDGYKFTNYKSRPGDSNSLSNNRIDVIREDKHGFLWVKTYDNRVHRFDPRTETFQGVNVNMSATDNANIQFTDIYKTSGGQIWLVGKGKGCYKIYTHPKDLSFQVITYSSDKSGDNHIPDNEIASIFEDSHQNVWISTYKGLKVVSTGREIVLPAFLQNTRDYFIESICEYSGSIWFGASNGRLFSYNLSTGKFLYTDFSVSSSITALHGYSISSLLIGTKNSGLFLYDFQNSNIENFRTEKFPELGSNYLQSFYVDKYKIVWVETNRAGIVRFIPERKSFKHFLLKTDPVSPLVYYGNNPSIFEDTNDILWINLKGGGFCYYNREADRVEYFFNEPGSSTRRFSDLVTYAMSDSYGNLWLSTHTRGIEKASFIRKKFKHFRPSGNLESLSANEVRAIFEDKNRFLWVATKEGKLYCYDANRNLKKVFSQETHTPGNISFKGMVYCIIQDKEGALWMGTKGDGIIRVTQEGTGDKIIFRTEYFRNNPQNNNSLSNDWVYTIHQDSKGRIWAGTYGGGLNLILKEGNTFRFINVNNSFFKYPALVCDKVRHLSEDASGRIWVATTNGLIVFNPNNSLDSLQFNLYQKEAGNYNCLANNDVHYIHRDKKNTMWVSTFGGGLGKIIQEPDGNNPPKIKNYTTVNGLPIDIVLSIIDDDNGNLWLSTENGLSKFNPNSELFTNYSELDGIGEKFFSEAACSKSHTGELFFGALNGFYSFFPENIQKENLSPNVVLVNLQLFNKDLKIGDKDSPLKQSITFTNTINLTYKQSVFSIEYAGLDFQNPEKLQYAFILEGFEKDWNYVRLQRKATYTNLPPGKYIFKVKCTTTGKFDDKVGRQLEIIILPPWWKTVWAYIGYVLLLAIISVLTRKIILEILRLRNMVIIEQKITEIKLRFFTNISHELRTPLTLIIGPTEELLKTEQLNKKAKEYLEIIDKNARRMLRHINNLLDFRKIQTGKMRLKIAEIEIISFVKDIFMGFNELAKVRNIDFVLSSNIQKLKIWIDHEKIDTVIFNLLSNAFKFTPEGKKIEVSINKIDKDGILEIVVSDHGVGIAKEDIPLLFERFAISHKSNSLNTKGTGIGLSLVKEIVELHHGTVHVESSPGLGSKFRICLKLGKEHFNSNIDFENLGEEKPIHNFEPEDINTLNDTKIIQPISDFGNLADNASTILIVEDNEDLRKFLQSKLSERYHILEALDGLDGWNKALLRAPDLIISDIMMPKMDGIELLDKLRSDFKTSHIPIILLTAKSAVENIIDGLKYGADAYITKPFNIDLLAARIQNLLDQRKRLVDKYQNHLKVMELAPDEVIVTAKDEQFLKDVIKIIEENISDPDFNIEKITQFVGLGRTTFFKKLKSLTGLAPVEFMKDMKLKRGYQLLQTGEFTISEIAYQLGFSDAGYFSKCFKEKYNTKPTDIIKATKKKTDN
jgi:signal transduction histidine kinase/ligand-binding sensor domain-containing protein/DNA-binding NarL/FixJ family response regulator